MSGNVKAFLVCLLALSALLWPCAGVLASASVSTDQVKSALTIHAPIRINSDSDFDTQFPGRIIQNLDIDGTGAGCCIFIGNCTTAFTIRNNYLHHATGLALAPFLNSGISILSCSNGQITLNNVSNNEGYGVYLLSSTGMKIFANNIAENGENVLDSVGNQWDDGYPSGGNYFGDAKKNNLTATINTSMGSISLRLRPDKAPITVWNFFRYAQEKFHTGNLFHRTINDFMIQGGGMYRDGSKTLQTKTPTHPNIVLETTTYLQHDDGAISMARTTAPNSANTQFFICDKPQHFLDGNYAVFGYVIGGMSNVRNIATVATHTEGVYANVPDTDITILDSSAANTTVMDDYSGAGQDSPGSDGIWDFNYTIMGGGEAKDRYPLVNPVVGAGPIYESTMPTIAISGCAALSVVALTIIGFRRKRNL